MRRTTSPRRAPRSADAAAAALSIYDRRRSYTSDQHLGDLPNPQDLDYLYGVAAYVDRHADVLVGILSRDIRDQIILIDYLHQALDRMLLRAITRARSRCGMSWLDLAEALGLGSAQGAQALHQRFMNAFAESGTGRRSEVDARAAGLRRAAPARPAETSAQDLDDLAAGFLHAYRQVPENLWEELLTVREAKTPDSLLAALRWLVGELDGRRGELDPALVALVDRARTALA